MKTYLAFQCQIQKMYDFTCNVVICSLIRPANHRHVGGRIWASGSRLNNPILKLLWPDAEVRLTVVGNNKTCGFIFHQWRLYTCSYFLQIRATVTTATSVIICTEINFMLRCMPQYEFASLTFLKWKSRNGRPATPNSHPFVGFQLLVLEFVRDISHGTTPSGIDCTSCSLRQLISIWTIWEWGA